MPTEVMIDKSVSRNRAKIEAEEKELEALIKGNVPQEEPKEEPPAVEELSKEEGTFKKRYGDLRRHSQEKEREWKEKLEALEAKIQQLESSKPTQEFAPEDIENWVKTNPQIAAMIKTLAAEEAEEKFKAASIELDSIREEKAQTARERAKQQILKKHPDFEDITAEDDFHDWAESQPQVVQDALYKNANDAASVIRALDLYKMDKGLTKEALRFKEKAAASSVAPKARVAIDPDEGGMIFSESQVAKMTDREYLENEDAINKAIRAGRFNYDISGAAR